MILKKLIVNGFKSFCDYSEITFDKGISAIVGPNGCGKSNIVDAIKWVIGEQKFKMLRANNMTDVIFKGTETRKGLGRAEVRLVLMNDDNSLPVEYQEVEIARIIYASGENEYLINKEKVRLKDINELFFDTGVGKSAYSFMEQGKIDRILSNKPEDRRYIIEEAAGITKYKARKDDALLKLKHAEENILRVQDILNEVKVQYDHMKVQADKAHKFKGLYDKEIELEIELNLNRVVRQKNIKQDFNKKVEKADKDLADVQATISSLENDLTEKLLNLNTLENKKIDSQREIFSIDSEIKVINSKTGMLKDQLININSMIKSEEEKIGINKRKVEELQEEVEEMDEAKYELEKNILGINRDTSFYEKSMEDIDTEIAGIGKNINGLYTRISDNNTRIEKKREEHKEIIDRLIEKINESLNVMDVNSNDISSTKKTIEQGVETLINELPIYSAFIDDLLATGHVPKNSDDLLPPLKELKNKIGTALERLNQLKQNISSYFETTEVFLGDIFDPQGVLQQKRAIETEIAELTDNNSESSSKIEDHRIEIEEKNKQKEGYRETLSELKVNLSTLQEKKNSLEKDTQRLESLKSHYQAEIDELHQKLKGYSEKSEDIKDELDENEFSLNKLTGKKNEIEKLIEELDYKIQKENTSMSEQQAYIKEINNTWITKKTEVEKLHIKIAEADTTINNIQDNFYENYSINLTEYESKGGYITDRDFDVVRHELKTVRQDKSSLGNVNLMAIEECKVLEERYNLLSEQLSDLEEAKKDLLKVIDELNKISEELFIKTFNQIKTNFHQLFRKLFDGGNAEIKLTDPTNLLETGISIIAHPPGETTKNITLLSGGQRTMVAISLMFATFLVKPSPFCLLDEIDAALDEENVTRFVNLLQEFKDVSQFIMISHNKKTISAADIMYGVTQETRGVSKIVSAKFISQDKSSL